MKKNSNSKRPAFMFYVNDWMLDEQLQMCCLKSQGLWISLMCIMHKAIPYGTLTINGVNLDKSTTKKLINCDQNDYNFAWDELRKWNVLKEKAGRFYSKRMVEDYKLHLQRKEFGGQGGNPKLGVNYNKPGYVYMMRNNDDGLAKIGISINPERRIYKIRSQTKQDIKLIQKIYVENMGKEEEKAHRTLEKYNENGEWFSVPEDFTLDFMLKGKHKQNAEYESEDEDETNTYRISLKDFASIWDRFPNKVGKKAAQRHFKVTVKTAEDLGNINKALDNYLTSERYLKGFVQNGSTWFNDWDVWIDYTDKLIDNNLKCPNGHTKGIFMKDSNKRIFGCSTCGARWR